MLHGDTAAHAHDAIENATHVNVEIRLDVIITARVARMYRFCLVCVCVCVCVSVRMPKTDNFITTSHFAFT